MADIFDQISGGPAGDIFDKVLNEKKSSKSFLGHAVGIPVGSAEIAASLATQTYGLVARGYGEIADIGTDIARGKPLGTSRQGGVADFTSDTLIYNPQTEYGKAGMDHVAAAFDWWHKKAVGAGDYVQGKVEPYVGPDAAVNYGASTATVVEALPLALGEAYGAAKRVRGKRDAKAAYAEAKEKLAKETEVAKKADLDRANLGEVIPEDPVATASVREAATRKVGEDIFDRIQRGNLGEEIPNVPPQRTPYEEWVMERDPSVRAQLEAQGTEVADRIRRGYLGDEVPNAPAPPTEPPPPSAPAPKRVPPTPDEAYFNTIKSLEKEISELNIEYNRLEEAKAPAKQLSDLQEKIDALHDKFDSVKDPMSRKDLLEERLRNPQPTPKVGEGGKALYPEEGLVRAGETKAALNKEWEKISNLHEDIEAYLMDVSEGHIPPAGEYKIVDKLKKQGLDTKGLKQMKSDIELRVKQIQEELGGIEKQGKDLGKNVVELKPKKPGPLGNERGSSKLIDDIAKGVTETGKRLGEILKKARFEDGLYPAVRDPVTGKIYRALQHKDIPEIAAKDGPEVAQRVMNIIREDARRAVQESGPDIGFVDKNGKFRNRADSDNFLYDQIIAKRLRNNRGSSQMITDMSTAIKEFFAPLSTIPESKKYMLLRYQDLRGGILRANRITKILSDRVKELSANDKKDAFNAIRGEIPVDTLPAELQLIVKQTSADIDRVGKILVDRGIISQEAFDANRGNYIHYMYLRHLLPDDVAVPVGSSGRLDLSYAKARLEERYPHMSADAVEMIRQDLGLIEDISIAAPVGMGKALGDIVKVDFFKKVSENPEWVWQPSKEIAALTREYNAYKQIIDRGENLSPEVVARATQLRDALENKIVTSGKAPKDYVAIPDSKAYGDLAGTMVRKEIANDIIPVFRVDPHDLVGIGKTWNKAGKAFDVGMTMFKAGKVALNPPTIIRNTISNFIQMNMSGIPLTRIPDTVIEGVKSYKAKDVYFKMFERYGGTLTNFSVAELGEVLDSFKKARGGSVDKFMIAVGEVSKHYGKIDDIAKVSLFKDAIVNQGMSPADAALYAQKWGMDYSLASRSVKKGRRYVLPFLSYQYKIAPLLAETIAKRPWVLAKYAAAPYLLSQAAAQMFDWSDKDLDKAERMMAERTEKEGSFTLLPVKDNKGNVEIVNLEYFVPYGNWLQVVRELRGGNVVDALQQFGGILGPYGNALTMLKTKRPGEPPIDPHTKQPIYSKLDNPSTKYLKYMEWWTQLFAPSSISSNGALGYSYKAAIGQPDKWGTEATGLKAFGRWFGMNVGSLNPQQIVATRKAKIKQLEVEMNRILRDPKYGKEDRKDALENLRVERRKILHPE